MANFNAAFQTEASSAGGAARHFTRAEWRAILEHLSVLESGDKRLGPPRKLVGASIEIVPDHHFG
jgi:hypothetical protein